MRRGHDDTAILATGNRVATYGWQAPAIFGEFNTTIDIAGDVCSDADMGIVAEGQMRLADTGSISSNEGADDDKLYGVPGTDTAVFTGRFEDYDVMLGKDAFRIGKTAFDADDRIIYDAAKGTLSFDADGSGDTRAVTFATLKAKAALTAADFMVV